MFTVSTRARHCPVRALKGQTPPLLSVSVSALHPKSGLLWITRSLGERSVQFYGGQALGLQWGACKSVFIHSGQAPEEWVAGLGKNEDSGTHSPGSPHGSCRAPQGWDQAALAPALCLTHHSPQLLQGADVTLVCEGPQDLSGHQQDQADRSGNHQGKGVCSCSVHLCQGEDGGLVSPLSWGASRMGPQYSFSPSVSRPVGAVSWK